MWSPTATRESPERTVLLDRVDQPKKSVVPPPMSITNTAVTGAQVRAPSFAVSFDPRVRAPPCGSFEQRDLVEAGGERGFDGQIARPSVERSGHGEHHFLLRQVTSPGRAERNASFKWSRKRNEVSTGEIFSMSSGAARGKLPARPAIDATVREPALGARDHPSRSLCAARARELTHGEPPVGIPGQGQGRLTRVSKVQKTR